MITDIKLSSLERKSSNSLFPKYRQSASLSVQVLSVCFRPGRHVLKILTKLCKTFEIVSCSSASMTIFPLQSKKFVPTSANAEL